MMGHVSYLMKLDDVRSILSQFHDMSRMKSNLFPCLEANVVLHGEVISQVTYCLTAPVIVRHNLEVASLEYLPEGSPTRSRTVAHVSYRLDYF